jgi:hypothetical protein
VASEDAEAGHVQPQVVPEDDEVAVGLGGHRRVALIVDGAQVDLEIGALRAAGRGEAAREDAEDAAAVLVGTLPGDAEVAVGVGGDRRTTLVSRSVSVDLELAAQRRTARVETPRKNALAATVLRRVALPGDDEVAVGVGGDDRTALDAAGVGIDLEIAGERRARGVEATGEDAALVAVLA